MQIKFAISGGRDYNNTYYPKFKTKANEIINSISQNPFIISGGASGIDSFAEALAKSNGWPFACVPANWEYYGKHIAGFKRNGWMLSLLDIKNDYLISFPGGNGTRNCYEQAEKLGINIIKVDSI